MWARHVLCHAESPPWTIQCLGDMISTWSMPATHASQRCTIWIWGRRGEVVSPIQSRLKPCYKGPTLNYVRTIWICAGAYAAAATHPYPTGASASLLSSLLRPNQAHVAWGRQAPGWAASASEECSRFQGGRLQLIEESDPVTTTNINQPTNGKWIVTLIQQWH